MKDSTYLFVYKKQTFHSLKGLQKEGDMGYITGDRGLLVAK